MLVNVYNVVYWMFCACFFCNFKKGNISRGHKQGLLLLLLEFRVMLLVESGCFGSFHFNESLRKLLHLVIFFKYYFTYKEPDWAHFFLEIITGRNDGLTFEIE